jgi:hypothetical protein
MTQSVPIFTVTIEPNDSPIIPSRVHTADRIYQAGISFKTTLNQFK